jgi:hypothetical protein
VIPGFSAVDEPNASAQAVNKGKSPRAWYVMAEDRRQIRYQGAMPPKHCLLLPTTLAVDLA